MVLDGIISGLLTGAAGIVGSIIQGDQQNKAIEANNQANADNVALTNATNLQIQKLINKANADNIARTNQSNQLINMQTNAANKALQDSINRTNAENVAATNQANLDLADKTNAANAANIEATNKANLEINAATNEANERIAAETNAANAEIQKGINDTNIALTQATNDLNKSIANDNLAFQRENYEYNKALQQQLFEREDTSYARTAYDMAQAGLNPLSMSGTNGAGSVVSTSAPQNNFQAIAPQVSGYTAVGATHQGVTMNPFQAISPTLESFKAEAARMTPYEKKIAQSVATKMESFQSQMSSYDWLNNMVGHIQDSATSALNHGIQIDQLREAKKNNEVDRIAKLVGTGYYMRDGKPVPTQVIENGQVYNPSTREAYDMARKQKAYDHDFTYNLGDNSTDFERNITGLQYMLDTKRINSIGESLANQAVDLFGLIQKLNNK